jgi:hypothetical protein
MAKLARREKGERGAIVPLRARFPAFRLHLMERIDELVGEHWSPW